jgi:hypothetical protein
MRIAQDGTEMEVRGGLSPPLRYFAASALAAARAFAASDIFFRVAAEITLSFAGAAADFLAAVDFFAGVLAGGVAERTYFRFLGATG